MNVGKIIVAGIPAGTCWAVAPDLVLTDAHCVPRGENRLRVRFEIPDAAPLEADVYPLDRSDELDAVLLKIQPGEDDGEIPASSVLKICARPPREWAEQEKGERWTSEGFVVKLAYIVTPSAFQGRVEKFDAAFHDAAAIQIGCEQGGLQSREIGMDDKPLPLLAGLSGAPVFLPRRGCVVGMVKSESVELGGKVLHASPLDAIYVEFREHLGAVKLHDWTGQVDAPCPPARRKRPKEISRAEVLAIMRETWIQGRLERDLGDLRDLNLEMKRAWLSEFPALASSPDVPSSEIAPTFDRYNQQLLILGSEGGGKTILLLQLARRLLQDAEKNAQALLPVVLKLSSWSAHRLRFDRWIVEELAATHRIPPRLGRTWVDEHRLLLLLDGLDEVDEESRESCIASINEYLHDYRTCHMAVTCREREYLRSGVPLNLQGAVLLQPLEYRAAWSRIRGKNYRGLRKVLDQDSSLRALLTTPFYLNLIKRAYRGKDEESLSHPPLSGPGARIGSPVDQRKNHLFEAYIDTCLGPARQAADGPARPYSFEAARRHLGWLAARMREQNASTFYIESLQSSWLPGLRAYVAFDIASSVLFGAIMGQLSGALAAVLDMGHAGRFPQDASLLVESVSYMTLTYGSIAVLVFLTCALGRITSAAASRAFVPGRFATLRLALVSASVAGAACLLLAMPYAVGASLMGQNLPVWLPDLIPELDRFSNFEALLLGTAVIALYTALLVPVFRWIHLLGAKARVGPLWAIGPAAAVLLTGALYFCARRYNLFYWGLGSPVPVLVSIVACAFPHTYTTGAWIRMVEQLGWKWSPRGTVYGAVGGAVFAALIVRPNAQYYAVYCLGATSSICLLGGLWGGLRKNEKIARRSSPGSGLAYTLRNVCGVIILFVITGILAFVINELVSAVPYGLAHPLAAPAVARGVLGAGVLWGLSLGVLFGLFLSGADSLIKHLVLRGQFWCLDRLPWRLAGFLKFADGTGLLRRFGPGFQFFHPDLREHFALGDPSVGLSTTQIRLLEEAAGRPAGQGAETPMSHRAARALRYGLFSLVAGTLAIMVCASLSGRQLMMGQRTEAAQPDEAIAHYRTALWFYPRNDEAYWAWGNALARKKEYPAAIQKYFRALQINPDASDAWEAWGEALEKIDSRTGAVEAFRRAKIHPATADAWIAWGNALADLEEYAGAIEKYEQVSKTDAKFALAAAEWGEALRCLKQPEQAIKKFAQAAAAYARRGVLDNWTFLKWGVALVDESNYLEALEKFEQVSSADQDFKLATAYEGECLRCLHRPQEANEKFALAAELYSKSHDPDSWTFFKWGTSLADEENYEEAIKKFEQVSSNSSSYKESIASWGEALRCLYRPREAIEKFALAAELYGKNNDPDGWTFFKWGIALADEKNYEEATGKFREAFLLDADWTEVLTEWGLAVEKCPRRDEAIEAFGTVNAHPKKAATFVRWGKILKRLGDHEGAHEKFRSAREIAAREFEGNL